jgi:NAD(P)-dependent dehydrogenase (short-subunit alcohol dehydrogenase family)
VINMPRLQGKVAIVTGGARGIGRATVELFAEEGATVYAVDVGAPAPPFDHAAIRFSTLDISSERDWARLIEDIRSHHGRLDILVNNAGIGGSQAPIATETLEDWNRVLMVNQTGTFLGMRAAAPLMQSRRSGSIINVSSIWGITAVAGAAAYHASKGAVRTLSKNAAITFAPDRIRVNSLHPGIVGTPLILNEQPKAVSDAVIAATPLGRMAEPRELAFGCLFLASDESSFMTGAELVIDGGYLAR